MKFIPPVLTVIEQVAGRGFIDTTLEGDPGYQAPLAPGGLYDIETQRTEAIQLHKLLAVTEGVHSFRTYGAAGITGLKGQRFVFRPWWTSKAFDLVANPSDGWRLAKYPNDGSHAHCELTYVGIGAAEEHKDGYFLGSIWVTRDAYENCIRDDMFHCRSDA